MGAMDSDNRQADNHGPVALAMDWGGTWARAAVVDRSGRLLWQGRAANGAGASRDELIAAAGGMLNTAREQAGALGRTVAGAGIALAGSIDAATGTLLSSPNLPALNGAALPDLWAPMLGAPVWVGNDANLAALGEYYYGAGRASPAQPAAPDHSVPAQAAARTLAYVTFSTGVGAGIVDGGKVFIGAQGAAGEVGHMAIDGRADAPVCACGNRGCLEALTSGTAIARMMRARLDETRTESALRAAYASGGAGAITGEAVFAAAGQGDELAYEALESVIQAMTVGLGNVLNLFNPDVLVLGGGVTQGLLDLGLIGRVESGTRRRGMSSAHRAFRLATATLGDSQGLAGAAGLVWSQVGGPVP